MPTKSLVKKAPVKKAAARRAPRRQAAKPQAHDVSHLQELVDRMRHGFIEGETAALAFLDLRGWIGLGYESCHTFWADKMSDVGTNVTVMKRVAFEMFDEGRTPRRVADLVKGLGPAQANALSRHKADGQEWHEASLDYVEARKNTGSATKMIVIEVDRAEYKSVWEPKLAQLGLEAKQFVYEAAVAAIKQ